MALVLPNERIMQHWQGALEASLRRGPLEIFLRSRSLKVAPRGAARDSDNICRATLYILRAPLGMRRMDLSQAHYRFLGQAFCSICNRLATLIHEPKAWRVAALVGTVQLLPRSVGLLAAANFSAESTRQYHGNLQHADGELGRLASLAAAAVTGNSEALVHQVRGRVVNLLADAVALSATPCNPVASGTL
jgi:hypothetical protein